MKKSMWYYANFLTHDWYNNGNDIVWNYYGIGADFYALPTFWNNAYIGIARANAALEIIAQTRANGVLPDALANRLEESLDFLRGMTYYYLAGTFGGVPLELKAETSGLTPRSSQDSVFMQVVSDMHLAEQCCSPRPSSLPPISAGQLPVQLMDSRGLRKCGLANTTQPWPPSTIPN